MGDNEWKLVDLSMKNLQTFMNPDKKNLKDISSLLKKRFGQCLEEKTKKWEELKNL